MKIYTDLLMGFLQEKMEFHALRMSLDRQNFKSADASRIFELQLFTSTVCGDKPTPNQLF